MLHTAAGCLLRAGRRPLTHLCRRVGLKREAVDMEKEVLNEPDFCDPDDEDDLGDHLNVKYGRLITL